MQKQNSNDLPVIAQVGHPALRKSAGPVTDILAESCQQLIAQMMQTVEESNGVGIAAPQIYKSLRIFVMSSKPNVRYPDAPRMDPIAIINPEIIETSKDIEKGWEGCLSVPQIRGLVPRFKSINVHYFDQLGNEQETVFEGFLARIFQHELDHLNGLTFLDRVDSPRDLISESEWYRQHST